MKNILYILFIIVIGYNTTAQITLIPDPKFEQFLINEGIDSDGVINGQMLTSDALAITKMYIKSFSDWIPVEYIQDVTGLEDFVNLDSLSISETMVGGEWGGEKTINLSTLVNLKYFYSSSNNLEFINFSNNVLLESIYLSNGGEVFPMDMVQEIDLSNNPNIHTIRTAGVTKINLKNGNNNENMYIFNGTTDPWGESPSPKYCVVVDNVEAAVNNQYPYSEWTVLPPNKKAYTDEVENCAYALAISSYSGNSKIKIYPNPVSDILYFDTEQNINKVLLFDVLDRKMIEQNNVRNISVSDLQKGSYILKLFSDKGVQTEKIVVNIE